MRYLLLLLLVLLAMAKKAIAEDNPVSVIVSIVKDNVTHQSFLDNIDLQYGEEYIHSTGMRPLVPWTNKWQVGI